MYFAIMGVLMGVVLGSLLSDIHLAYKEKFYTMMWLKVVVFICAVIAFCMTGYVS